MVDQSCSGDGPDFVGYSPQSRARIRFLATLQAARSAASLREQIALWSKCDALREFYGAEELARLERELAFLSGTRPGLANVLRELRRTSLDEMKDALASMETPAHRIVVYRALQSTPYDALRQRVEAWCRRFRLTSYWMADVALQALALWSQDGFARDDLLWAAPGIDVAWDLAPFVTPGWNAFVEPRAEFITRAERELRAYADWVETQSRDKGAVSMGSDDSALFWLWRVLALRESTYAIERDDPAGRKRSSIDASLKFAARALDLELPRGPRGRPKKQVPLSQ